MPDTAKQTTLALIKPDAVAKKLTGKIIDLILQNGLDIIGMKTVQLTEETAEGFYEVHKEKPFFPGLMKFMVSGPIVVLALRGDNAIVKWRSLMGATNPEKAEEGTIRKMYGTTVTVNASHGSDAPETAAVETAYFFKPEELLS